MQSSMQVTDQVKKPAGKDRKTHTMTALAQPRAAAKLTTSTPEMLLLHSGFS